MVGIVERNKIAALAVHLNDATLAAQQAEDFDAAAAIATAHFALIDFRDALRELADSGFVQAQRALAKWDGWEKGR